MRGGRDSKTIRAARPSEPEAILSQVTVESGTSEQPKQASVGTEASVSCTNVPSPARTLPEALGALLESWNGRVDRKGLRRALLDALSALDE